MIAVTFGLARYGYGLLLPEMRSDLAVRSGTAGLISSGTYASYLVANVAVVWVATRFGSRLALGLAAGFAATGMAVIASAQTVPALAAGVMVAGAAAGLAFPPYADLVARRVRRPRRDLAWSTISSGTGWGVAIAGPIAIAAGDRWRTAWLAFTVLAVGAGVAAVLLAPGRDADRDADRATGRDARRDTGRVQRPRLSWTWFFCPRSRPLLVSAVLVGAGSSVWWVFSVDALREAGMSATPAKILYATCGAASILASLSGAVVGRLGLRGGYLGACAPLAASLVLVGLATAQPVAATAAAIVFGIFYSAVVAVHGTWSTRVFADHPSAGLAAVNTALTIGTLLGPVLAGVTIQHTGYRTTLVGAGVTVLLALACCPPTARRKRILAAHRCTARPVGE